ncbi:MAG: hypothetical protein QOC82_1618 [Frankiaceae bacterium]|jgi:hypothetical protein|nr:hypothetical protein [Frankiaceae bacterium]
MRADWDRRCASTLEAVRSAQAAAADDPVAAAYLDRVANAVRSLHDVAAGRRYTPLDIAAGLVHDEPAQLATDERYAGALAAIDALVRHWRDKLGAPEWDWAGRGYPPGWTSSVTDRLRAGLFYRAR